MILCIFTAANGKRRRLTHRGTEANGGGGDDDDDMLQLDEDETFVQNNNNNITGNNRNKSFGFGSFGGPEGAEGGVQNGAMQAAEEEEGDGDGQSPALRANTRPAYTKRFASLDDDEDEDRASPPAGSGTGIALATHTALKPRRHRAMIVDSDDVSVESGIAPVFFTLPAFLNLRGSLF